jgi:predicted dehydrogenase
VDRVRVGLVGAGQMGRLHARTIAAATASGTAELAVVVDADRARAEELADLHDAQGTDELVALDACDAVIVASSTDSHAAVAASVMAMGRPVLVEKPLAPTLADAEGMVAAAARAGVPLLCGFVERWNPVVRALVDLLDEPPVHVIALRHSPPATRIGTDVVSDLLIHDIDLALRIVGDAAVVATHGSTAAPRSTGTAEIADCTLTFANGALATLSASRAAQRKVRSLRVATASSLFELDLLRQTVDVYRHVEQVLTAGESLSYRATTTVDTPFVRRSAEPLAAQLDDFCDVVRGRTAPPCAERDYLPAHRVAAAIQSEATRTLYAA